MLSSITENFLGCWSICLFFHAYSTVFKLMIFNRFQIIRFLTTSVFKCILRFIISCVSWINTVEAKAWRQIGKKNVFLVSFRKTVCWVFCTALKYKLVVSLCLGLEFPVVRKCRSENNVFGPADHYNAFTVISSILQWQNRHQLFLEGLKSRWGILTRFRCQKFVLNVVQKH